MDKGLIVLSYGIDRLTQFVEEVDFLNSLGGYLKDTGTVLELHRASQMIIYPDESILDKQNEWTSRFLKQKLSNGSNHSDKLDKYLVQEVVCLLMHVII